MHVGGRPDLPRRAGRLFWSHVLRRPEDGTGLRLPVGSVEELGQAEVGDLGHGPVGERGG